MDDATRRLVDATLIGEAVESLPIAVFVSDVSLRYIAVNEAAARLVGLPRSRLLELRVPDVDSRPQPELEQETYAVERGGPACGETELRRSDGELIEVAFTTMKAEVGHLPVLVSFVQPKQDVTLGERLVAGLAHHRA